MKVLITGASGFIGRHLVERLLKDGHSVIAFVNQNAKVLAGLHGDMKIVSCDITRPFEPVDEKDNLEAVVHLAGIVGEAACSKDARKAYELNVVGTVNLLCGLQSAAVMPKKFIYLSSASVYDQTNKSPISEEGKISDFGIYNSTKLAAEQLVSGFCSKYEISCSIGRAAATYGPYQLDYSILSAIIMKLLEHDRLTLPNPYNSKDYINVADVVEAIVTLLNTDQPGLFNISSGQGAQFDLIAETIARVLDKNIVVKALDEAESRNTITSTVIDNTRLKRLGWEPRVDLEDGLRETVSYFRDQYAGSVK